MNRTNFSGLVGLALLSTWTATAFGQQSSESPPMPIGVIGTPAGTGPYPAVAESFASMRNNTVYRPADMPETPLPLILWGNGACRDNGLNNGAFLREVASHGFIVVAAGYPRVERGLEPQAAAPAAASPAPPQPDAQQRPADPTQPQQLLDAIDWAAAASRDPGSVLQGRVDLDNIGVMGHSCGGLQAVVIAADPRVDTMVSFNSGVLNAGPETGRSGISVTKSQLLDIHGPVAYINGGPGDIAYSNGKDDFERLNHVPAFFGENGVGHGGTFWSAPNGGEYADVAVAWMSWQLKQDAAASRMFVGPDCGLCTRSNWKVRQKDLNQRVEP